MTRYIIASAPSGFLLIRVDHSGDGAVIAEGTRAEMVSLRDSLLTTEPTLVPEEGPIVGLGFLLPE